MKTSTPRPAPLALLTICAACGGSCKLPYQPRRGSNACLSCGGRGFALALRRPVLQVGYAVASRAEHIAVLALIIEAIPSGDQRSLEGLRLSLSDEADAVLAHCDADVAARARVALARKTDLAGWLAA